MTTCDSWDDMRKGLTHLDHLFHLLEQRKEVFEDEAELSISVWLRLQVVGHSL